MHDPVERHLQDGASVVTIAVSSRLVHHRFVRRLRHPNLFVVSVTPTSSLSPSPQLVRRLRNSTSLVQCLRHPSCSSSPSRRLVHRLRHAFLFIVSITPSCSSSASPRFVRCLRHPVLFIVSVSQACSSSLSSRFVHPLRLSVLFIVSFTTSCSLSPSLSLVGRLCAPYSFCIHIRSYIITISYYTCFSHVSNQVNSTHQSLDNCSFH